MAKRTRKRGTRPAGLAPVAKAPEAKPLPETPGGRWAPGPLLLLASLVLVYCGRFLFTGDILLLRDLLLRWNAWQIYYRESILSGALPLWNPYMGCGEPFLADIQTATLYPLSLVFVALPVHLAVSVGVALHLFLAALGTYALSRFWGCTRLPSVLAAMAYAFGAMLVTRIEFYPFFAGTAWLPLVLYLFLRTLRRQDGLSAGAFVLALSMQFLAGYPEASVYTGIALFICATCIGVAGWLSTRQWVPLAAPFALLFVAGIWAFCLCAVQVLPTWEAQGLSYRAEFDPELYKASMNPMMGFTLIHPFLYGTLGHLGRYWAPACYEYWVAPLYAGVLPIMIVLLYLVGVLASRPKSGPRNAPDGKPWWQHAFAKTAEQCPGPSLAIATHRARMTCLAGMGAFAVLYSMGWYTPFFKAVWITFPLMQKFRWPTKSIMLFSLALCILSAIALSAMRFPKAAAGNSRRVFYREAGLWGAALCFPLLGLLCWLAFRGEGTGTRAILNVFFNLSSVQDRFQHRVEWEAIQAQFWGVALLVPVSLLGIGLYLSRGRAHRFGEALLVLVLFADLWAFGTAILPLGPKTIVESRETHPALGSRDSAQVRFMEHDPLTQFWLYGVEDPAVFRLAKETLAGSWADACHVPAVTQNSSFMVSAVSKVLGIYFSEHVPQDNKDRLLQLLNCGQVVYFPDLDTYFETGELGSPMARALTDPLPRAFVTGTLDVLPTERDVLTELARADYDPRSSIPTDAKSVRVNEMERLIAGPVEHTVHEERSGAGKVVYRVKSQRPAVLFMSDTYFPGWKARVDGESAEIRRAAAGFRAVCVPEGESEVVMEYAPMSFRVGAIISSVTALGTAVFLAALLFLGNSAVAGSVAGMAGLARGRNERD